MYPLVEQRQHKRYLIAATAFVYASTKSAQAVTRNLSASGAFFETEIDMSPGTLVTLILDWPAPREGHVNVVLVLGGQVRRVGKVGVAMSISRHRFCIGEIEDMGRLSVAALSPWGPEERKQASERVRRFWAARRIPIGSPSPSP